MAGPIKFPKDLGVLLAGLEAELGELPAELAEQLGELGLTVSRDEASGLRLITLQDARQLASQPSSQPSAQVTPEPIGLDVMLEHMNADQLKLVAKRYHPDANAGRVAESKRAVLKALAKPALLDAMIAGLSPLERALMSEVKRQGGVADGWALIVYAALRGFAPNARVGGGGVYKHRLADAPGMGFLGAALRDGLLIPASNYASWFKDSHYYGYERTGSSLADDLVFADRRVLARLPDELRPAPKRLELRSLAATGGAPATAAHPVQGLLELFDVMGLVFEEGGLQVTQSGRVGKPMLSRLAKRRPWLEARLERLLELAVAFGFLVAPENPATKDPWRVNLPLLHKVREAPLPLAYTLMVEAFLRSAAASADDAFGVRQSSLVSPVAAKRALLEGLEALPDHAARMEEALEGLWQRALRYVIIPRPRYWQEAAEPERPAWFAHALLGTFRDLGLVAVAELPEAGRPAGEAKGRRPAPASEADPACRYALVPAAGLGWLARGRRLREAELPPSAEELRALLRLDPETGKPEEPSLLIQPNFDVLVYLDKLSPLAVTALSAADCTRVDAQTASYTLSRSSLYRALEAGLELEGLLERLQEHSMGVPDNVARSLRDWASRRERLRLREGVRLLEYNSQEERDAALRGLAGARALAERFVLLEGATPPKVGLRHRYSLAPTRTLRFQPEGTFRLEGATDLAGRAALAQVAKQDAKGSYRLDVEAIRAGALTTAAREALVARAQGGIPPQLEALMSIWEGKSAAPTVAKLSVFQHPSATALAKHPKLAALLGTQLNATSYLIKEGREEQVGALLTSLGVALAEGFKTDIKAEAVQSSVMQTGLNTRKMRAMIETAIAENRALELRYHREKESYTRYGYAKKSKGKMVTEEIVPESVRYSGSTPYLSGKTPGGDYRDIRIGYISGVAVL